MESGSLITVEVVYAERARQWLRRVELPAGATVGEAIERSGLKDEIPGLQISEVAVFGRLRALDAPVQDGERVEILRPLLQDPKAARRDRARKTPLKR